MRVGKPLAALGLLLASLLPLRPLLAAAQPRDGGGSVSRRLQALLPFLHQIIQTNPAQAIVPAGTQGTVIDPAHLEEPVALERSLRNAMSESGSEVHLTVTNGTAHLGATTVKAGEVVRGHLVVLKGNIDITGRVEGNVVALDGNIIMHQGAAIVGDVLAIGGKVESKSGQISGAVTESAPTEALATEAPVSVPGVIAQRAAGLVGIFVTMILLSFAVVTFARPNLEIVSDTVSHSLGRSFTSGLLGELLILPSIGLILVGLVITIIGTVLVPFALVVLSLLSIVALVVGLLAVAFNMGETITRRRMAGGARISPNAYRYMFTGLSAMLSIWVAWVAFGWVPVAGSIILAVALLSTWVVGTIGFGAALLSRGGAREHFAGRFISPIMLTDEHLWATPRMGVPIVRRPPREDE